MAGEIEVTARGFLGADAETRTIDGRELVELDVAVNVTRRPDDESKDWPVIRTDWVRVSVWGHRARHVATLKKGTLVVVEGTLKPGAYLGSDGAAHPSVDVVARNVYTVPRAVRAAELSPAHS